MKNKIKKKIEKSEIRNNEMKNGKAASLNTRVILKR
tara:strand:+ start:640 stop:747 length:108 start_codon:yes stop_codon:yes gene_type:complete